MMTDQQPHSQPVVTDTAPEHKRPVRVRRQNVRLSPDEWDLGLITEFVDIVRKLGLGLQGEGPKRKEGDK